MTIIYVLLILVQAGVIVYFVRRGRNQAAPPSVAMPATDTYEGLRQLALNVTPSQLKLAIPANETIVYGVVMDWNMGDITATLAAYITGAANMYLSNGGGVNGGGKSVAVAEIASSFVVNAGEFMGRTMQISVTDLPPAGCVRFYLLTNKGIYAAQEQLIHFDDGTSAWLGIFEQGNEVITAMKNNGTV